MVAKERGGFRDWIIQRLTAIIIGAYAIFIIAYVLCAQPLDYMQWEGFFRHVGVKIFTVLAFISIIWHAWIGLWTVFTDYVKPKAVRYILETFVLLLLLGYLVWMIDILWR